MIVIIVFSIYAAGLTITLAVLDHYKLGDIRGEEKVIASFIWPITLFYFFVLYCLKRIDKELEKKKKEE